MNSLQVLRLIACLEPGAGIPPLWSRLSILLVLVLLPSQAYSEADHPFYKPDVALYGLANGTLLKKERVPPLAPDSTSWRVLYVSQSMRGDPIAVSGLVVVPNTPASSGGYNVLSWGHGTTGIGDQCAPSRGYRAGGHTVYDIAAEVIKENFVLVATDYEGLGTLGVHPYLVGESEGRGMLDIVRAAASIPEVGSIGLVALYGLSQGGQAALFAGEIATSWAPELDVIAVISSSPGFSLHYYSDAVAWSLSPGILGQSWMIAMGYEAAYGDLSLENIFQADALKAIRQLKSDQNACTATIGKIALNFEGSGFKARYHSSDRWIKLLKQNNAGNAPQTAPVLLLQGMADANWLFVSPLDDVLCAAGTQVDYRLFWGYSHPEASSRNLPLILHWVEDRISGLPLNKSSCD